MLSQLTRCAKNLWARLSSAASQFFRRLTEPARPNLVTGTLADLRAVALNCWPTLACSVAAAVDRPAPADVDPASDLARPVVSGVAVSVARLVQNWKPILQIIQPDTLLRWHRAGFSLFWKFNSRPARPAHHLDSDAIA